MKKIHFLFFMTPWSVCLAQPFNGLSGNLSGPANVAPAGQALTNLTIYGTLNTTGLTQENCTLYSQPTTGQTVTPNQTNCGVEIDPAGTLAALTVKTPPSPIPGQIFWFSTTQTITALSVVANTGSVFRAGTTPTTLSIGTGVKFIYNINTVWYPHP